MDPHKTTEPSSSFEAFVTWAAAFSMAVTGALLASVRQIHPTVQIRFSALTVIAFFVTGALTVVFFRKILRHSHAADVETAAKRNKRLMIFFVAFGVIALLASFALSLKNVSRDALGNVLIGAGSAVAVLTFIGWCFWRVVKFLEADERRHHEEESRGPRP